MTENLPQWHELLDQLALDRGHRDNLSLAQALCELNGNPSQSGFDTAIKNLRNWRAGHHVPQRRNFLLLTQMLEADSLSPEAVTLWHEAYRRASKPRQDDVDYRTGLEATTVPGAALPPFANTVRADPTRPEAAPVPVAAQGPVDGDTGPRKMPRIKLMRVRGTGLVLGGFIFGLALGAALCLVFVPQSIRMAFELPIDFAGPFGQRQTAVILKAGQSMVAGSVRAADCSPDAPSWDEVSANLPDLETGDLHDGGAGTQYDPHCGDRVGARGVLVSANQPGEERFYLGGEPVLLKVY